MTSFSVGKATITRIEETYLAVYRSEGAVSGIHRRDIQAEHAHWLAPNHYDPAAAKIKLSVHSWLLQIGGRRS